jgi:hypothetical protein
MKKPRFGGAFLCLLGGVERQLVVRSNTPFPLLE